MTREELFMKDLMDITERYEIKDIYIIPTEPIFAIFKKHLSDLQKEKRCPKCEQGFNKDEIYGMILRALPQHPEVVNGEAINIMKAVDNYLNKYTQQLQQRIEELEKEKEDIIQRWNPQSI
jgi:hypothetical protein